MASIDLTNYDITGNAVLWPQMLEHTDGFEDHGTQTRKPTEPPIHVSAHPEPSIGNNDLNLHHSQPQLFAQENQNGNRCAWKRRIVVCGSMSTYSVMMQMEDHLRQQDVIAAIPDSEDHVKPLLSPEAWEGFKRKVSMGHIRRVRDPRTFGILVVNLDKYGVPNYIGANTFAEVAIAFAQSKKIYLLCDIPDLYMDELKAWGVISLQGDIERLVSDYRRFCYQETQQLGLFDGDAIK